MTLEIPAKIRLGLLFGGQSAEREVSAASAQAVAAAASPAAYDILPVRIERDGTWVWLAKWSPGDPWEEAIGVPTELMLEPGGKAALRSRAGSEGITALVDVIFPVLHGPNGEDGSVQGLLQMLGVAFVGTGVLGSAIGMDKDVMKRLLREAGLPTARCMVLCRGDTRTDLYERAQGVLGLPMFVKPANTGSSVGISKVRDRNDFDGALLHAFAYDDKVVLEQFVDGREVECGVIGTSSPRVSMPGEIVTTHDFYSYEAKYHDASATSLLIPATMSQDAQERVRTLALKTYRTLYCEGMARVDFFVDADERIWINEVNTIPGFTRYSMFPLLWAYSGMSLAELVDYLVADALVRQRQRAALRRSR